MSTTLFSQHVEAIRKFGAPGSHEQLLLAREGAISVHYAPFDWVNQRAKVVLVGITPGTTQMVNALQEARRQLAGGQSHAVAAQAGQQTGAFSGAMRKNLIALMDHVGLHVTLGLSSCQDLFNASHELLQSCSVLPFPVFVDGNDYNGTPNPLKNSLLRKQIDQHFAPIVRRLQRAVFVPLGRVPSETLLALSREGALERDQVLDGLPHPSGANAERISYFLGHKTRASLSLKTDPVRLDNARAILTERVARLSAVN